MSEWECGVCSYLHKEDQPPEKCPVCDAPEKMFTNKQGDFQDAKVEQKAEEPAETATQQDPPADKQWCCSVCGYLHKESTPPEKCPVCDAPAGQFEEVVEETEAAEKEEVAPEKDKAESNRRWRCTVCGYIHEGDEPPEKCPLCGAEKKFFEEIDAEGNVLGADEGAVEAAPEEVAAATKEGQKTTLFDKLATLSLKLHLHAIHTHFPNGILPVIVIFLALAIYFNIAALETAAFFNSIAVLLALPIVMLTGYIEWQKRYRGIKSAIFITKIICSLIVLGAVNVLVFWRLLDPGVAADGSSSQMIYFAVAGVALGAAGIAGHLGGKLAFAGRNI